MWGNRVPFALLLCNIYSGNPLVAPVWRGPVAQGYSSSGSLLGLLALAPKSAACLFGPVLALSVGSGCRERACVRAGEGLMAGAKFCVGVGPSVFVWRGMSAGGRSLGLRPRFLPGVAPFLTSALIPLFSTTLVLVLGATWVAAARNQFWDRERVCYGSTRAVCYAVWTDRNSANTRSSSWSECGNTVWCIFQSPVWAYCEQRQCHKHCRCYRIVAMLNLNPYSLDFYLQICSQHCFSASWQLVGATPTRRLLILFTVCFHRSAERRRWIQSAVREQYGGECGSALRLTYLRVRLTDVVLHTAFRAKLLLTDQTSVLAQLSSPLEQKHWEENTARLHIQTRDSYRFKTDTSIALVEIFSN